MNDIDKALARIKRGIQLAINANSEEAIKELTTTKEVLEKQVPKKIKGISITHEGYVGNCPVCNKFIRQHENKHYCNYKDCGQAIDWSREDERS